MPHDKTIILRDQEAMFQDLLTDNKPTITDDGYAYIISKLVHNNNGDSIDDRIVAALTAQNRDFQIQNWTFQQQKLADEKDRWNEVTGFIQNRGERDWTSGINDFVSAWSNWRTDMRQQIDDGDKQNAALVNDFSKNMTGWQQETAAASTKAGSAKMAQQLVGNMNNYLGSLNQRLPNGAKFDVDIDSVLSTIMRNQPTGIGVLADSMNMADTTAGFTNMLNLGLNFDLFGAFQKKMDQFSEAEKKMQAVQEGEADYEVMQAILAQFNQELADANQSNFNSVDTDIKSKFPGPWKRGWSIEVVTGKSVMGGKEKEMVGFADYRNYVNSTVFLKPLKGFPGEGNVDFNNPYTYENLNVDEIKVFSQLEEFARFPSCKVGRIQGLPGFSAA